MSRREDLRARYIEGWNTMDAALLVSSVTEDFVFDDPAEPRLILKADLPDYLPVWPAKAAKLGARFEFEMTDKVVQDQGGILLEWYWWRLIGTDVEGAAVIRTTDEGVQSERLVYYRCPWPLRGAP